MKENMAPYYRVIALTARDWWDDWINLVLISIAWVLSWLTLILGPPATLGIFYVTNHLAHGDKVGLKGFFEGGKSYFWVGWKWMLVNLFALVIFLANFYFYAGFESLWGEILKAVFIILGALWLVVQFYALPYLIEAEHKYIGIALRNGLFTFLASPFYTLIVITPAVLAAALSITLVIPIFLGGFCWVALLGNHAVIERLDTFQVREHELTKN